MPYLLVVESDPDLQRQIADTLREAEYELSTERESAWARRSLGVRVPDGLIVGTGLPDGTGFEVAHELRQDPDGARVPIFFLAGRFRGPAFAREARRRFAPAEYLPSPPDLSSLLARVMAAVPPPAPTHRPPPNPEPAVTPRTDLAQEKETKDVEKQAKKLTTGQSEIEGALARQSFARLLRRLYTERRTGALLVMADATKKIVYFSDGYPVSVRSNVVSECLGQILAAQKRISPEVLELSVARMKEEKRQQGEILIEMGALSPHGLQELLVAQMEAKLFDLFSWTKGNYVFKEDWTVQESVTALDRPTAALILEGVRRHYKPERVEAVLNTLAGKFVVRTTDALSRLQGITSDGKERRFIDAIDGTSMLEAILNVPPIPRDRARTLLCAMIEAGMVVGANTPPNPSPGAVTKLSPIPVPPRRSRSELAAIWETMRTQNHFEILGIAEDEKAANAVEGAYERLARIYHPDTYRTRSDGVRVIVDRIFSRLSEARAVLGQPARRKSYLARLERARSYAGGGSEAAAAAEEVYFTGVEHLKGRRYDQAVDALRQATVLVPGQSGYHGALAWAIYRRAPTDEADVAAAQEELEHAVSLDLEDPWIKVSLGRFFEETGLAERALECFEGAAALAPGVAEIEDELRRLRGAP